MTFATNGAEDLALHPDSRNNQPLLVACAGGVLCAVVCVYLVLCGQNVEQSPVGLDMVAWRQWL